MLRVVAESTKVMRTTRTQVISFSTQKTNLVTLNREGGGAEGGEGEGGRGKRGRGRGEECIHVHAGKKVEFILLAMDSF